MAIILGIVFLANSFASIPFLSYYMQNKYSVEIHTVGLILGIGSLISGIPPLLSSSLVTKAGIMFGIIISQIPILVILCLITFIEIKLVVLSLIFLYLALNGITPVLTRTLQSLMVSKEERASATALVSASMLGFDSLGLLASGFLWGH